MKYTDLDGNTATAEPWTPGPLYATIWALRPDGSPVVVNVPAAVNKPNLEVPWEQPLQPREYTDRQLVAMAEDVIHRQHIADINDSRDWYIRIHVAKEGNRTIKKPTKKQVDAARAVLKLSDHNRSVYKIYREAHIASTPISAKRFMELWQEGSGE